MKAKHLSPTKGLIRGLLDCLLTSPDGVSGFFDVEAFLELSKRKRQERRARAAGRALAVDYILEEEVREAAKKKPPRPKRSCKKLVNVSMFDSQGNVVPLDPKFSTWLAHHILLSPEAFV